MSVMHATVQADYDKSSEYTRLTGIPSGRRLSNPSMCRRAALFEQCDCRRWLSFRRPATVHSTSHRSSPARVVKSVSDGSVVRVNVTFVMAPVITASG